MSLSLYLDNHESEIHCLSIVPFSQSEAGRLYRHILKYTSWKKIVRTKKHKAVSHCANVPRDIAAFRNTWKRISGIYKITFLPFRLFTYYGSSSDLGMRFKYHYFNGPKTHNFLGLFLKVFGWDNFSITVIETSPRDMLAERENWYLFSFQPLLNVLMKNSADPRVPGSMSLLTRSKISATLTGRKDTEVTRAKKSASRMGSLNPFFGLGPGIKAVDAAAVLSGTKVYVYDVNSFTLVNNKPFRSIRKAAKLCQLALAPCLPN